MVKKLASLTLLTIISFCSPVIYATHSYESIEQAEPDTPNTDSEENIDILFKGPVELGYGLELIGQTNFDADGWGQGLIIGKEFYQTDHWNIGVQGHIVSSSTNITNIDRLEFDAYTIMATATPRAIPFVQFKAGLVKARYENIFGRNSDSGTGYGLAIVTGSGKIRLHWLDYEVYKIGDDKFRSGSIGIVIIFCVMGGCA